MEKTTSNVEDFSKRLDKIEEKLLKNEVMMEELHTKVNKFSNGFKEELISRLLDTLEIRKRESQVTKQKILDWIIKLTLSGGMIYTIIENLQK
ncbi:hypothetical protein [Geotoga petraea]|uniref:Uncharacterized protein n=1 Tax=Geotoga petraea TaxID=28234 RepID=A0A1G6Q8G1_9BACT|nr:hypothetical protein [Geotoga petraea]TGG88038.1 hypothetical protein E4650_06760 [Geotoga petraea]SDC88618.1 hypothetical protein SAMN04488588_2005 [Geotoga petraea]